MKKSLILTLSTILALATSIRSFEPAFDTRMEVEVNRPPYFTLVSDFDQDGNLDLLMGVDTSGLWGMVNATPAVALLRSDNRTFFDTAVYLQIPHTPHAGCTADFNGDGFPDVAIVDGKDSGALTILLNQFGQGLSELATYQVGQNPSCVEPSDLDGDGDIDLVVGNENSAFVSVRLSAGDGTFDDSAGFPVGTKTLSVCVADFNGDSIDDIAAPSYAQKKVYFLNGTGTGSFTAGPVVTLTARPTMIRAADLNGDTRTEIAVAVDSASVFVMIHDSSGGFVPVGNYPVQQSSHTLSLADLDGDGDLDLAVPNCDSSTLSILFNQGNGTYSDTVQFPTGGRATSVTPIDINNDGELDLVTNNVWTSGSSILLNKGGGTFSQSHTLPISAGAYSIQVGDVDNDTHADVIIGTVDESIQVLRGNGDGSFSTMPEFHCSGSWGQITTVDFNADGNLDVSAAGSDSMGRAIRSLYGDGAGGFAQGQPMYLPGVGNILDVGHADFNLDGYPDLTFAAFYGSTSPDSLGVAMNNKSGGFDYPAYYAVGRSPRSIAAADLDGNNWPDLIATNSESSTISILSNNGNATFTTNVPIPASFGPAMVFPFDIDYNGTIDLLVAHPVSNTIAIYSNDGSGHFSTPVAVRAANDPWRVSSADINGDGLYDIITGGRGRCDVSVAFTDGSGGFLNPVNFGSCYNSMNLALSDFNEDGKSDIVTSGYSGHNIAILLNQSQSPSVVDDGDLGLVLPTTPIVSQNYPNPFNPTTTIEYSLSRRDHVEIIVFNSLGQLVRGLLSSDVNAGQHFVEWNGRDDRGNVAASGAYFYRVQIGDEVQSKKMLLLK